MSDVSTPVEKTDAQWRDELSPEQDEVLRRQGTERSFAGTFVHTPDVGLGGRDRFCIDLAPLPLDPEAAR